jgi:polysaccharide chain length determinant protein (PEP-CTERM system associated)
VSKPKGIQDYLAIVVRRRWWVVVPFLALAGLTGLFVLIVPKVYLSETLILIQPRDVPTDFVMDLIAGSTDERLVAIEQTILSRTNLLKILGEFEDRMTGYRGLNDEQKYVKLKKRVALDVSEERRQGRILPTTSFRIRYRDQNPEVAQKVTARLAALFIEQDSRARETQVFGTTEFLQAEVNKVAEQLKQSSDNLKVLKERYRYELPSELDTNLRTLDRLQLQKTANVEALDRHTSMLMTLERQLSETPATVVREAGSVDAAGAPVRNPLVEVLRKREQEYNDLRLKATEDHPDVVRARAEVERLRKEIPPDDLVSGGTLTPLSPSGTVTVPNPVYQSLTAQISQIRTEIAIREREKIQLEGEMARYTARVQNTPKVEQDMAAVLRADEDLSKQYQDLKSKLEQAKLAGSLESKQKGAQFVVVDPANYPIDPASPKLPVLILGGLALSLAAGVVCAWAWDLLNRKIWTQRDLERFFEQTPVLVEIPVMVTGGDIAKGRRRAFAHAFLFLVGAGVYGCGLYFLYLKQPFLLRLLDPLLERVAG